MRALLWKAHRWVGLFTCVAIAMWGLSGLSHPIMTRLQPAPKSFMPPKVSLDAVHAPSPGQVLRAAGLQRVHSLNTVVYQGQAHWLAHAQLDRPGMLINSQTGEVVPDGERLLAMALAGHYTGRRPDEIASADIVIQFDDAYLPVNRLLPVWRITYTGPGQLQAYVDTRQMRLATLVDDKRRALTQWFRWAHNWSFLSAWPKLQMAAMTLALCTILTSALTGLYFWWTLRRSAAQRLANRLLKRWHRRIGLIVALTSLTFACSGMFHLWVTGLAGEYQVESAQQSIDVSALDANWIHLSHLPNPVGRVSFVSTAGLSGWLVHPLQQPGSKAQVAALAQASSSTHDHGHEHGGHDHHDGGASTKGDQATAPVFIDAEGNMQGQGGRLLALHLAKLFTPVDKASDKMTWGEPTLVTKFSDEYGFLNKRLPVWRIPAQGSPASASQRLYIEPDTATLGTRVKDVDAIEGWSFAVLHKWNIGPINKDLRDALSAVFALGNVAVACMGFVLFWRKPG